MLCYMTGMTPPTSTNDEQGTVIDGTARSAEWRKKQRAAQRPSDPGPAEATTGVPVDFDPAAAKDFVSSLMIPANNPARETAQEAARSEAPDAFFKTLLGGSREQQPTPQLEDDATAGSAQSDQLDRWFEEKATSVSHAPTGQRLPRGTASVDIETDGGAGVERARRVRALRVRRAHEREHDQQRRGSTGRRCPQSWVNVTRTRALAAIMLTVLSIVAIGIATGGPSIHRSPISPANASTSATISGLIDTFMSNATRLPHTERLVVRARRHRRPSHRTDRAPKRRPSAHAVASTGAAPGSSYTPTPSQAEGSPPPAASARVNTSSGGGSSPAATSSPSPRTGPTGPISLIGAGTSPSG
jgi:hypothetical protein